MTIDFAALFTAIGICAQIFFIDLLLSADNALVIALACRGLPAEDVDRTVMYGTAGAIFLRLAMAAIVVALLQISGLKIIAGVTLLIVAIRLILGHEDPIGNDQAVAGRRMASAVIAIIAADAVMSLDNVVALAAVAQGSLMLLGLGLLLSVPMLIKGSAMIRQLFADNGLLISLSGMFLGWLAGQIAVTDPAIAPWISGSAPALFVAVPCACAIFVVWEARILAAARQGGLNAR